MPSKLLRPNVGIYIATADAFSNADITVASWKPTLAQITDPAKVFNVSPAITDAYTLNLTDSDSNSSLSVVDNAQVSVPTAYNYEVSLDGFRDSGSSTTFYNKFKELVADAAVGTKYYIIKRTGKAHNAAFAVGDNVSVFGVTTDYADDLVADGEMIRVGGRFMQTGEVAVNTTVSAGAAAAGPWGTESDPTARATGTKMQSNGNVLVYWVPSATVTDSDALFISSPKLSFLNAAASVNLTEAIAWDGYTLGASESNKIDDKSIIDKTNAKTRGFAQFSGSLTFFRPRFVTGAYAATGTASASTITLTTVTDSTKIEIGMKASGTGVGTGAVVTGINTSTGVVTLSVVNSAAVSGSVTFTSTYSLPYDLFKSATDARPNGWLVTRVGKAATTALAVNDTVSVFKFTADAVMDNTEGEDSMKFMVNFMPQGQVGVNVKLA